MAEVDLVQRRDTLKRGAIARVVRDPVECRTYYMLDGGEHAVANVTWLDYYGGLAQFSPVTNVQGVEKVGKVDGFFYVRNAGDLREKGDEKGDPLVRKGWGMYIWDPVDYIKRKPATNAGWILIARQTDVDWDIDDELKNLFVLKTIYNQRCNTVDNRFKIDEALIKAINNRIVLIENNWDKGDNVHGKAHWHDNKAVLDELEDNFNFLYYRGRPISGNSFVYDHIENGEIVWCDPTKKEDEWTHEVVKNSFEIATRFGQTTLGRVGLSLFVMEVDGSVSIYKYNRVTEDGEESIQPRFAQTCVIGNRGVAEYVDLLPEATKWHYQRGCWVPLQDDGEHAVGHLHECVEEWNDAEGKYIYYWRDITSAGGNTLDITGSQITLAYSKDDTLWKQNCIFLTDPETTTKDGKKFVWRETKLVRKYGAAPESVEDGEVVVTYTTKDKYKDVPYLDVIPFTQAAPVYYAAFSTTTANDKYAPDAAVEATKLTWLRIRNIIGTHRDDLGKIFKIGDTVVLPPHRTYGNIECEVVGINQNAIEENEPGLLVVARNVICNKSIDVVEEMRVGTSDNEENVTNTETGGNEPSGSNGQMMPLVSTSGMAVKHVIDTLNVISWLNSANNPWEAVKQTDFDVMPSDDGESGYYTRDHAFEAGFLNGFEEADRYMFQVQRYIKTTDSNITMNTRVLLPYGLGITNMSKKYKQLGRARASVPWGTLKPGVWPAHLSPNDGRPNYGFMTYAGQEDGTVVENSVTPQTVVGIAPMFFIGGIA